MNDYFYDVNEFVFERDEEDDMAVRSNNVNERKSAVSACIYEILMEQSSYENPFLIYELVNALKKRPYELKMDRRAISRQVQTLVEMFDAIHYERGIGAWYEKEDFLKAA